MRSIFALAPLTGVLAINVQQPLFAPSFPQVEMDEYQFSWPIQKVAIIGAGPSGLVAYRELTEAGLDVRIFERDSVPGGIWHYTEEVPLDAPVPNAPTAISDFVPSLPPTNVNLPYSEEFEDDGKIRREHRGPKPIWESLTSNVPSPLQQFLEWPWPASTPWEISHYQIRNYVRSYASYLHISSNDENPTTVYNTRVERIEKKINKAGQEQGWTLWLKSLEPIRHHTYRATWWTEDFDAVVVAVGKYHAPSMPSIPGLEQWVRRFPDRIRHSRQYRRPEAFTNQTVLIVGASVSGPEISRDLNHHAREVYVSFRPDKDGSKGRYRQGDPIRRIPRNTTLIGEIGEFLHISKGLPIQSGLVELKNGTVLSGFDSVIFATGFRYSYPFLAQYYDGAPQSSTVPTVSPFLPSDGSHVRDLYLDLFYIRDPTLAFLDLPLGALSFPYLDYTTLALAKVWTNTAKLPSNQTMWAWLDNTIRERGGYGKHALFIGPEGFLDSVRYLISWLNEAAVRYGGKQVNGLPKCFYEVGRYWLIARFGIPPREDDAVLMLLGPGCPGV